MEIGLLTLGDHRADPATGVRTTQAERHAQILEYIDYAEPAGFDAVFVGEHHFSDFLTASPPVFLAWLAGRTERIKLGSGVTLLPHHDAAKLAEDFGTLDVVSGGRAEMWVGRGVEPYVYGYFGQDESRAVEMQDEGLGLLVRLWTETDVTWSGEFRAPLHGVTLQPRPVQTPHMPIKVAVSRVESAVAAAELGFGIALTLLSFDRDLLAPVVGAYRQAFAEAGHSHEPWVDLNAHVHVAPTSQEARDHLSIYQAPFQRWVFGKKLGIPADEVELPSRITDFASPECAVVNGSPAEVVDRVGALAELCDFDRFSYQGDYGGQPWPLAMRSLDLFAGVMDEVRDVRSTTSAPTGP
jgi:alkanesulfonate monooxygenase SsuD/methylene tetrahydromethanopterin reductase-like flavin-dependent oxidoreductase (luciferase family)